MATHTLWISMTGRFSDEEISSLQQAQPNELLESLMIDDPLVVLRAMAEILQNEDVYLLPNSEAKNTKFGQLCQYDQLWARLIESIIDPQYAFTDWNLLKQVVEGKHKLQIDS